MCSFPVKLHYEFSRLDLTAHISAFSTLQAVSCQYYQTTKWEYTFSNVLFGESGVTNTDYTQFAAPRQQTSTQKISRCCFLNLTQLLLPVKWYRQMIHCDCFFMKKQQNHKAVSKDKPETRCICNPRPLQLCASIFRLSWVSGLQNSSVSSLAGSSCHLVAVTAVHHILLPLKLPQTHSNGKWLWR